MIIREIRISWCRMKKIAKSTNSCRESSKYKNKIFIYIEKTNSVNKIKTSREDKVAEFCAIGLILFSIHSPTSGILNSRALS